MSYEVREKIIDKIRKYLTAFKQFNMEIDYQPREILEMIEQEGYTHPDDLADGMVVKDKECPGFKKPRKCALSSISCDEYPFNCYTSRPATVRECLAGLAVKG